LLRSKNDFVSKRVIIEGAHLLLAAVVPLPARFLLIFSFSDFEWDFDVMLRKKKEENKKQRKRRRDGSIDLLSDADDQIKELIEAMKTAAKVSNFF
jgi:hypothetical protein